MNGGEGSMNSKISPRKESGGAAGPARQQLCYWAQQPSLVKSVNGLSQVSDRMHIPNLVYIINKTINTPRHVAVSWN